jgi:maleylacetoacetate isomerase/maleylpyruvate isomerase
MTQTLTLYGYWRSMAAYRVRAALNLKGVAVDQVAVDLDTGEQFAPEFLAINPEGAVPALIEPGRAAITQSMAILEYLEERFPQPPLLPADLEGRARVRSLAALVVADTHPLIVPRVRSYLASRAAFDDRALRAWSLHWMARGLDVVETRLAGDPATGAFCHGERPTMADLCLASLAVPAKTFAVDLSPYPTVARIVDACERLDAFARAHPRLQAGAPQGT